MTTVNAVRKKKKGSLVTFKHNTLQYTEYGRHIVKCGRPSEKQEVIHPDPERFIQIQIPTWILMVSERVGIQSNKRIRVSVSIKSQTEIEE